VAERGAQRIHAVGMFERIAEARHELPCGEPFRAGVERLNLGSRTGGEHTGSRLFERVGASEIFDCEAGDGEPAELAVDLRDRGVGNIDVIEARAGGIHDCSSRCS